MSNLRPRISQDNARLAARALDLATLEQACQDFSPERSRMIISLAWSRACERQDIPCLEELHTRSVKSKIWEPESYSNLATIALRFNKDKSMTWLLPHLEYEDIKNVVSDVLLAKAEVKQDITDALLVIARHSPSLMADFELPLHKLNFIDFTAQRKDPDLLAQVLVFSSHTTLVNYNQIPENTTVEAHWWEAWSRCDKPSYEELVFWDKQTLSHPHLSRHFQSSGQSILGYALMGGSKHSKTILSKPPGTREFQVMEQSFENGGQDLIYLATMIHAEPAALAFALKKNPRFAKLVLNVIDEKKNNILHLLAFYRCHPSASYSKKNLSWARLENWTLEHASHLVDRPNKLGKTPLHLISQHTTWHSKFIRHLLGQQINQTGEETSSGPVPSRSIPKM